MLITYSPLKALEKIRHRPSPVQIRGKSAFVEKKSRLGKSKLGYVVGGALTGACVIGMLVNYLRLLDIEQRILNHRGMVMFTDPEYWREISIETAEIFSKVGETVWMREFYSLILQRVEVLNQIYMCGELALLGILIIGGIYVLKGYLRKATFEE